MTTYQLTGEGYVVKNGDTKVPILDVPAGYDQHPETLAYRAWLAAGGVPLPADSATQFQRDEARYTKRAAVRDNLMAFMAADNMSRVRSGVWQVSDLTALMDDPAVTAATAYMGTLAFELAAQAIQDAQSPLLTQAIKDVWVAKLEEHYYLEG